MVEIKIKVRNITSDLLAIGCLLGNFTFVYVIGYPVTVGFVALLFVVALLLFYGRFRFSGLTITLAVAVVLVCSLKTAATSDPGETTKSFGQIILATVFLSMIVSTR